MSNLIIQYDHIVSVESLSKEFHSNIQMGISNTIRNVWYQLFSKIQNDKEFYKNFFIIVPRDSQLEVLSEYSILKILNQLDYFTFSKNMTDPIYSKHLEKMVNLDTKQYIHKTINVNQFEMVNYLQKKFTLEYLYQIIVIFKKKTGSKSNFDNDFTNV
ncbi:hypothetical protein ACTFIT_002336 [Dictyostelium discoideum]